MAAIGTTPLEDRTWIVTGASSGIGKATALDLALLGGTVVLACRDAGRGEAAQREIVEESKNPKVSLMILDLASQASIISFAEQFTQDYRRLDALVNNAGVYTGERRTTPEGLEETFAVNYLGGFLLSHLLLDLLIASAPSRLAQILFTIEFARRLSGTGVTVNACHPGVIKTNLGAEANMAFRFVKMFFKSPAKGAETPVFLAASPSVATLTGQYFADRRVKTPSKAAQDPYTAKRLYEVSLKLAGLAES